MHQWQAACCTSRKTGFPPFRPPFVRGSSIVAAMRVLFIRCIDPADAFGVSFGGLIFFVFCFVSQPLICLLCVLFCHVIHRELYTVEGFRGTGKPQGAHWFLPYLPVKK